MKQLIFAMALTLATTITVFGQGYDIGDIVTDFNLKSTSGKYFTLNSLSGNKGAVIIFTCNQCPFSIAYEDRIIALNDKFADAGFPVIAINPNDAKKVPEDSYRKMIKQAKLKKYKFPYLYDESQETAKKFGATRTPHVFILEKSGNNYKIVYIGAIDNNSDDPAAADKKYVENAITELLNGKEVSLKKTKAIGCGIKWKD